MNDLGPLHALLQRIGRRRRMLRWSIGLSGIVAVVCAAWLGLFAIDWGLQLGGLERAAAIIATVVALGWSVRRFVLPWLSARETELQLALLLQRLEGIDTDLVAALQFEARDSEPWGSSELQAAVIRRVASITPSLPLREDTPRRIVGRRLLVAASVAACTAAVALVFPEHARVFNNRLLLRADSYPTATRIDEIRIAGQTVERGRSPAEIRCPLNTPVDFRVKVSGRIPQDGWVQLATVESRESSRLPLLQQNATPGAFASNLPILTGDCECRIRIGDASAGPILLRLVQPPELRLGFQIREPDYGDGTDRTLRWQEGVLQLAVPEGSWVRPWLISDRPLNRAVLYLGDTALTLSRIAEAPSAAADVNKTATPQAVGSGRERSGKTPEYFWTLERNTTSLADVTEPVRLEFVVEDREGSGPLKLQAILRPRPDQPPRIAAESRVSLVLPQARPTILCRASDDRGLVRIEARAERLRTDGAAETLHAWTLWNSDGRARRQLEERFPLDLSATGAVKGDRLRISLTAVEQGRDGQPGRSVDSAPITLDVTDEQGILAAMAELDRKSADQLQQMIDRQLEVGGSP
ncbi:MAG: hypothetical protein Kow0040_06560 [Thermogutta sp.]